MSLRRLMAVGSAVVVVVGVVVTGPAADAATTGACAPITADGQNIACLSVTEFTDASGNPTVELTVSSPLTGLTVSTPPVAVPLSAVIQCSNTSSALYVGVAVLGTCDSAGAYYERYPDSNPVTVHVPQLCVTTTATCVGPFDQTLAIGGRLCVGKFYSVPSDPSFLGAAPAVCINTARPGKACVGIDDGHSVTYDGDIVECAPI
jgi:hypothetical protein